MRACAAVRSGLKLRYLLLQPRDVRHDSLLFHRRRRSPAFPTSHTGLLLLCLAVLSPYFHRTFAGVQERVTTGYAHQNPIVFGKSLRGHTRASGQATTLLSRAWAPRRGRGAWSPDPTRACVRARIYRKQ